MSCESVDVRGQVSAVYIILDLGWGDLINYLGLKNFDW